MNAKHNMKSGFSIEEQLRSVRMSEHERNAALHAVRVAEGFVDAIAWAGSKLERFGAGVFAKPSPKY